MTTATFVLAGTATAEYSDQPACDGRIAEISDTNELGYRERLSQGQAKVNRERRHPLADPYCEGTFQAPVSRGNALVIELRALYLGAKRPEFSDGGLWSAAWPFVSEQTHPGIGGPMRIQGWLDRSSTNYQLDAINLTPDTADHRCDALASGTAPTEYEVFTWDTTTLARISRKHGADVSKSFHIVASRDFAFTGKPTDPPQRLLLPAILNPADAAEPKNRGLNALFVVNKRITVIDRWLYPISELVTDDADSTGHIDSFEPAGSAHPGAVPEEHGDNMVPREITFSDMSPNNLYLPVGAHEDEVLVLELLIAEDGHERSMMFYLYVPPRTFVAHVIEDMTVRVNPQEQNDGR